MWVTLKIILWSLLFVAVVGLVDLRLHDNRLLSVQTDSMSPTFRPGDALVISPVSLNGLQPGDIVSYHSPRNPNVTITHRLVSIDPKSGWLTTAGDHSKSNDPSFPPQLVIGRARWLLPGFGRLLDLPHQPFGLAATVYLPAISLIVAETYSLSRSYARPLYSARL